MLTLAAAYPVVHPCQRFLVRCLVLLRPARFDFDLPFPHCHFSQVMAGFVPATPILPALRSDAPGFPNEPATTAMMWSKRSKFAEVSHHRL
jgi:hypothetical protein